MEALDRITVDPEVMGGRFFQMTKEDWEDDKATIDAWPHSS